jgi:hypothetical protein
VLTLALNAGGKVPVVVVGPDQSAVTGLAHNAAGLSAKLSKGGASAAFTLTALNWTEGSDGVYYVTLAAGDTDTAGACVLLVIYNGAVYRGGFQVSAGVAVDLSPVQTVVDAIKLSTDNLPSDPADQSLLNSAISAVEAKVDTVDNVADAILARTDVATSTRLAAADYTAPPSVAALATQASVDALATAVSTIDGLVDDIKAKTDALPASPANEATLTAMTATLARLLGLGGHNVVIDTVVVGVDGTTSCRVRSYDSQANADAAYATAYSAPRVMTKGKKVG